MSHTLKRERIRLHKTAVSWCECITNTKGRTIRKVMGGGGVGKKPKKKIHARENAKKKNSCKEEGKEKKFMQKEGPIVIFIQYIKSANKHVKMELTGNSQIY